MLSFLKRDKDAAKKDSGENHWAARLRRGLTATRSRLGARLAAVFSGGRKVDEQLFEDLEAVLLSCDVGVDATRHLLEQTRARALRGRMQDAAQIRDALRQALLELLAPLEQPLDLSRAKPFVILMAGVNGAGKTTSIGKLASFFRSQGKSVLLAAGDTYRAAAREQLKIWGERNDVAVVAQEGGDTAAVIFDAVHSALSKGIDVVIADTAGRLPTQPQLMEEIRKVKRVIAKVIPEAPHEVLLVLDANTGQNAIAQVKAFDQALGVSGIILTKLDGTAKGGAIAAIARHKPIPLRFVGVGEGVDDLRPFSAEQFVEALFE
ncbi:MAG: signal recognition particle-docking protein FtsY [Betaproteobacteria bacterium]